MAGIGLLNFEFDAKSIGPIAALGAVAVVGYFGYKYWQGRQTQASNPANAFANVADTAYANDLQLAALQSLFGNATTTQQNTQTTVTGGVNMPVATGGATTGVGSPTSGAGGNSSAVVGSAAPGSI